MKQLFSLILVMVIALNSSAQQKFGIATYTVPAGWQLTEEKTSVTLERKTGSGICRISIFTTKMPVGVLTVNDYTLYRASIGLSQVTYSDMKGAIKQSEANGLTSFASHGTVTLDAVRHHNSFYSVTNGRETYFVQLSASDNNCINIFNNFLDNLLIDPVEEKSDGTMNAKKTSRGKKASPAPMPAAPEML